ncbi:MAG TPA: hypothetical protein VN608_01135 [Clostridia bacterium]|nr:hypothetical protein [Clostridia bacterium]
MKGVKKVEKTTTQKHDQRVGVINYLGSCGHIRECFIFTNPDEFMKEVLDSDYYGVPMSVYISEQAWGDSIPKNFMEKLSGCSTHCSIANKKGLSLRITEAEAQRIVTEMKALGNRPNSPNKTHFMVELSEEYLLEHGDTSRLISMLPYKSLYFSSITGQKGIFAFVRQDEPRDKDIRTPSRRDYTR